MTVLWRIVERDGSIVVLTIIQPFSYLRHGFACEFMTIELTYEILCSRASKGASRVDVANQHPLGVLSGFPISHFSFLISHFEQVRAFPHTTVVTILLAKRTLIFPLLQVFRRIDTHLLTSSQDKVPSLDVLIPERAWIAEVGHIAGSQHRIACIFRKGASTILRESNRLRLVVSCRGVHCYHLISVGYTRTAEDATQPIGLDSQGLCLPMNKVARGRVSPRHVLPLTSIGIVLII